MLCREIDPAAGCPGELRPDRHRTRPGKPTRAWKCRTCGQRFIRCMFTGKILTGMNIGEALRASLITEALENAKP